MIHRTESDDGSNPVESMNAMLYSCICPTPHTVASRMVDSASTGKSLAQIGTFTDAIYDTAWVSMVGRKDENTWRWLFPSSFRYVLESQQSDGTWPQYASLIDGIINTLAGLLALITHRNADGSHSTEESSIHDRITRACKGLASLLSSWNVNDTDHVAFEIIVPALLRNLEQLGHTFDFEQKHVLMSLYSQKMQKFTPQIVYSKHKTTMLHSLEAFQGLIDFDKVKHHCNEFSGICGSPASTAAYLINSSQWDNRAEFYLSNIIENHSTDGGVPNAFPTGIFELSWAASMLWSPHISIGDLSSVHADGVANFLDESLKNQGGIVGFTPGVVEDADDTARTILSLRRLSRDIDLFPLITYFQSKKYFKTYTTERNPSFSANCNVLLALLESSDPCRHQLHLENAVEYLIQLWNSGPIKDKWNLSSAYSHMLLSEAFISLLKLWERGAIFMPPELALEQIPLILCQILMSSIQNQKPDGSWNDEIEITAYNLLLIIQCLSLPLPEEIRARLDQCLQRGKAFISGYYGDPRKDHRIWIEKTTYQPRFLKVIYCSLALHATHVQYSWSQSLVDCFSLPSGKSQKFRQLLLALPRFRRQNIPCVELTLLESALYSKRLLSKRDCVIPRSQIPMTKDTYIDFIPVIWLACNSVAEESLTAAALWEMMQISMLNYQVDEYMESVIALLDEAKLEHLISVIDLKCGLPDCGYSRKLNSSSSQLQEGENTVSNGFALCSHDSTDIMTPISKYINHFLEHPTFVRSPPQMQQTVANQLRDFLVAHIDHNRANAQYTSTEGQVPNSHRVQASQTWRDYFEWVTSTAANDTSCPLSFHFFCCLISQPGTAAFTSIEGQYISQTLVRHMATMCRQHNDYGSAQRDFKEGNLNSLDFREFEEVTGATVAGVGHVFTQSADRHHGESRKASLMNIADFERLLAAQCLQTLEQRRWASKAILSAVKVFMDVTDVWGQIYMLEDISSKVARLSSCTSTAGITRHTT